MIIKLRSYRMDSNRIREQVFVGEDAHHLQLAGELILGIHEWNTFEAALMAGAKDHPGWQLTVLAEEGTL